MLKRKKPLLRKTPLKRSTQPIKRTAIKRKINTSLDDKPKNNIKKSSTNVIPKLTSRAEQAVNYSVRERDSDGGYFDCIACGKTKPVDEMQAGHFYSKTYSGTRYHEDNIHGECIQCNCFDPNHLVGYKIRLIAKIGIDRFNNITKLKNKVVHWDREELKEIIQQFSK